VIVGKVVINKALAHKLAIKKEI